MGESDELGRPGREFGAGAICRRDEGSAMLCDTCRWTERPGFVRSSAIPVSPATGSPPRSGIASTGFVPCPDCGGHAIAHCCEGLCEQPEVVASGRERKVTQLDDGGPFQGGAETC